MRASASTPNFKASTLLRSKAVKKSSSFDGGFVGEQARLYAQLPFLAIPGLATTSVGLLRETESRGDLTLLLAQNDATEKLEYMPTTGYTVSLLLAVLVSLLATFQNGYNTGVVNAPKEVVFPGHTEFQWSLVVSVFCIGGLIGAFFGGMIPNRFGRKKALVGNSVVFLAGGALMGYATGIPMLLVGRFLTGVGCGAGTVFVPLYLGELAPPNLRGALGTLTQFSTVVGILAADVLAFPLATTSGWRYLFAVPCAPALLTLCLSGFLHESPRWLLLHGREHEAVAILRQMRDRADVSHELDSIRLASDSETTATMGFRDVLRDRRTRPAMLLGIALQMAQQLCGINAVFFYSSMFFADMELSSPLVGTTLVGFVNVVATGVALGLMDRVGRKPLLLWGTVGCIASLLAVSAALTVKLHSPAAADMCNSVALLAIMLFVSFFEVSLGPIPWLMCAEMFPAPSRAAGMAICVVCNWTCNFIVGVSYPAINAALGVDSWLPFIAVLCVSLFITSNYVIETKDKTLEEIQVELALAAGTGTASSSPSKMGGKYFSIPQHDSKARPLSQQQQQQRQASGEDSNGGGGSGHSGTIYVDQRARYGSINEGSAEGEDDTSSGVVTF